MDIENIRHEFKNDRFATDRTAIIIDEVGNNYSKCSFDVHDFHLNKMDTVMGGAIFTLADFAFAVAANSGSKNVVSASCTIKFLKTAKTDKLFAEAICIKDGNKLAFYDVKITDKDGAIIAIASITGCVV